MATESHARSSHVHTREGENSRDRGMQKRLHVQYGERSPTYVRGRSPRVEDVRRRSPALIIGNDREVVIYPF